MNLAIYGIAAGWAASTLAGFVLGVAYLRARINQQRHGLA
jgi:hypothetical protein